MQLETALVNCFCNTELRTATVSKIKGLSIQTQLNTFVLFTSLKLTLDERKTLTKISTCNLSQQFPPNQRTLQTRQNKKQENWQKSFCIIGGESLGIRISSRNNKRIKTTNENDGKINKKKTSGLVLYKTLDYFSTKLASFLSMQF